MSRLGTTDLARYPEDLARANPGWAAALDMQLKDYWELIKPRMNFLVICTTAVGYYMSAKGDVAWGRFCATLTGTGLTAAGAAVLNQAMEHHFDALMPRTARRPVASGRISPFEAAQLGLALAVVGTVLLVILVNVLTAVLATITVATYLLLYTPAKRRTTLCTLIGAVPGAIPVVMGCTAAGGRLTAVALALFAILFVWQIPHFMAIAIIYHEDYARGGFRMLPVGDEGLKVTVRQVILYSLTLVPVTMYPAMLGISSPLAATAAAILSVIFSVLAFRWTRVRSGKDARKLFLASVLFLPIILSTMMIGKT